MQRQPNHFDWLTDAQYRRRVREGQLDFLAARLRSKLSRLMVDVPEAWDVVDIYRAFILPKGCARADIRQTITAIRAARSIA